MVRIIKRYHLSKSEIKGLNEEITKQYNLPVFFDKKDNVVILEGDEKIVLKNDEPVFFYYGSLPVPTLKLLIKNNFLKKIVIDMRAIPFISNGADLMRPGIKSFEEGIKQNDFVSIVDEKNNVPIAVGIALYSSIDLRSMQSGKVAKNIHRPSDKIWSIH